MEASNSLRDGQNAILAFTSLSGTAKLTISVCMLKIFSAFLFSLLSLSAFAQTEDSRLKVNTLDDAYDVPSIRAMADVTVDRGNPSWGISQRSRNRIFYQSGLSLEIVKNKYDELDQDLLFEDLKNKNLSELLIRYSNFSKASLARAQKLIRALKDQKR